METCWRVMAFKRLDCPTLRRPKRPNVQAQAFGGGAHAVVLILYVSLNASKSNSFPVQPQNGDPIRNFSHLERQRAQRNGVEESAEAFSGKRGKKAALQPSRYQQ